MVVAFKNCRAEGSLRNITITKVSQEPGRLLSNADNDIYCGRLKKMNAAHEGFFAALCLDRIHSFLVIVIIGAFLIAELLS